jgi:hypothetical protein
VGTARWKGISGNVENRIKELKLELKADRLSCHRFLANLFRLLLHIAAYCLFWLLRRHLTGTELATAQVNTLRLKLLKIGACIRETSRRSHGFRQRTALQTCSPRWSASVGIRGRPPSESVAGSQWNGWPESSGICSEGTKYIFRDVEVLEKPIS